MARGLVTFFRLSRFFRLPGLRRGAIITGEGPYLYVRRGGSFSRKSPKRHQAGSPVTHLRRPPTVENKRSNADRAQNPLRRRAILASDSKRLPAAAGERPVGSPACSLTFEFSPDIGIAALCVFA